VNKPVSLVRILSVDEDFLSHTFTVIEKSMKEDKPFLAWFNPSRLHIYTILSQKAKTLQRL
jgi:arylsulfatase